MSADSITPNVLKDLITNDEEVRIVMLGKTGVGKSATGNTILGFNSFESKKSFNSVTTGCSKFEGVVAGRKVSVIDTPGLFDTTFSKIETCEEVRRCISLAAPGPHVFLILINLMNRFTEEEQKSVEMIQEMFGQMSNQYSIILCTHGDGIEDQPIESLLSDCPELQELITKCGGRYHVFNNKTKDRSQVTELMEKISNMVKMNGGSHYTNEMFQVAERAIEEEKQRILKENEERRRKKEEKLKRKYEIMALEREKKLEEEHQARLARKQEKLKELSQKKAQEKKERMQQMQKKHEREKQELKIKCLWGLGETIRKEREERERAARRQAERKNRFTRGLYGAAGFGWEGVKFGAKVGLMFSPLGILAGAAIGGVLGAGVGFVVGCSLDDDKQSADITRIEYGQNM